MIQKPIPAIAVFAALLAAAPPSPATEPPRYERESYGGESYEGESYGPAPYARPSAEPAPAERAATDAAGTFGRPVDLCLTGSILWVACERGEALLAVDARRGEVLDAHTLGGRPAAVVPTGESSVAVVDRDRGRVVRCESDAAGAIRARASWDCVPDPIAVDRAGDHLFVAGCWSRQVQRLDASGRDVWTADLDFAPGVVRYLQAEQVVLVADEFGSRLAILDAEEGHVRRTVDYFGHRVRGICEDPDGERIVVSHQMLNYAAQSTRSDIHWGMTMANDLRWLSRQAVLSGDGEAFYAGARVRPIGAVGDGGADPNDVAVSPDGHVLVALGGVDQVAVGRESDFELKRVAVGRNPVAVACDDANRFGWVACRLDDSLAQIDLADRSVARSIALGESRTLELVALGERLFHDASLSHDGWMSCASCHPGGHAVNERADTLGDQNYGAPKRVLSLLGKSDTAPFGWTGAAETLEAQIDQSIHKTMRGRAGGEQTIDALAAYLRTLEPPPSAARLRGGEDRRAIERGRDVFARSGCADCHTGEARTSPGRYDVGLSDENGHTEFNPPSLRGVGQRGPRYFHDLSAASLREVFAVHEHQLPEALAEAEIADLVAFLESL